MFISPKKYIPLTILLLVSMSCAVPGIFTTDTNAVSTSVAQTVAAMVTQNTPQATLLPFLDATLTSTPTSTSTFTPEPPTSTSTSTATFTATLTTTPFSTSTPLVPLISVSVDTNCRNGPGKIYDMVGALLVGQIAQVYGRDPTNRYWYIRNPGPGPEFCWVWGEYATLVGPALLVPVFTPPPTPTATRTPLPSPAFTAEYIGLDTCSGSWWAEIKLINTGTTLLKSVNISVKDKVTDIVRVNIADGFTNLDGCLGKTTKDTLTAGDTYLLSTPAFTYNPEGHKMLATIILCSDTGQKGMCVTKTINFTP